LNEKISFLQLPYSINTVCKEFDFTRQNYYQRLKYERKARKKEDMILEEIQKIRALLPYVGCRKLQYMLKDRFQIEIGRDALFSLLRKHEMLIQRQKSYIKTTNSMHHYKKYLNLIKDMVITRCNQVWVADITYIRTWEGFWYLFLITDKYSRKIVGWSLRNDLRHEGAIEALQKALKTEEFDGDIILHSDRGIQYCCPGYTQFAELQGIRLSMTQDDHVYENALAERVNGILKQEFGLGEVFKTGKAVEKQIAESVMLYNSVRPHLSLGFMTPDQVHKKSA
jgi:putative transposase